MPGYLLMILEDDLAKKKPESRKKEDKTTSIIVYAGLSIIAVLVVIALIRVGQPKAAPSSITQFNAIYTSESGINNLGLPYLGKLDAPITIIEYEDFGCHNCKSFVENAESRLIDEYVSQGKVLLVSYPVAFVNAQSIPAAEAAECALDQGLYWAYRHLLFENQGVVPFTRDNMVEFAEAAGLDVSAFTTCYDRGAKSSIVQERTRDAQRLGVSGTPTFDIEGQRYQGVLPYSSENPESPGISEIIENALLLSN